MLRKLTATLAALALGAGAAFGVAACGEDRGSVEVEGGTGTGKTGATGKTGSTGKTGATGKTAGSTTPTPSRTGTVPTR